MIELFKTIGSIIFSVVYYTILVTLAIVIILWTYNIIKIYVDAYKIKKNNNKNV